MDASSQSPSFEVRCERCRVSFPVGTRRCMHCNGALGRKRRLPRIPVPPGHEEISLEVEDEAASKPGMFSPVTLVWILLLLGGYLWRSCGGQ